MSALNPHLAERIVLDRAELTARIAAAIHTDGTVEALEGLHLNRLSAPSGRIHGVSRPSLCVIAQGKKEVYLGAGRYPYDPATVRLRRLIDAPAEARVMAPLVKREIVFRLLMGEQGDRLRHLSLLGSHSHRIGQAIERLRNEFDSPLKIESVARDLGMSTSGFHQHFKAITDMSPLQFQKQLRLQEARRLMLGENLDATSAAFRVGYHDASQFSREYKRHFGQPPAKDVDLLRRG